MKKRRKKFNCIIASIFLACSLTGCLPGYNLADVFTVDAKAWINGACYFATHRAFAFLYDIDHISFLSFTSKNPLLNVCKGKFFYKLKSHVLYVNNDDGTVYTDELLPYANSCFEDLIGQSIELSDTDKIVADYDPSFLIETTEYIRNNGIFSKKNSHETTYHLKGFPADFSEDDVDNYMFLEYPYMGDFDECYISTDKSCKNLRDIISLKGYADFFKDSDSLMIYCPDGYIELNSLGYGDNGYMDISACIYKKESVVFDDKVRIDYYNEYSEWYTYSRADDDYSFVSSDYYPVRSNFIVKFSEDDAGKICSIRVCGDEAYDIYLANAPSGKIKIDTVFENGSIYTMKCKTKKYDDNWTKLITYPGREKKINPGDNLQTYDTAMFSNDGGSTLNLYKTGF